VQVEDIGSIRRLLFLLGSYDIHDRKNMGSRGPARNYVSSGSIFRTWTTYEDLFALCQEIKLWSTGQSDNALTTSFLDVIEQKAGSILSEKDHRARIIGLGHLASAAAEYIQHVVVQALTVDNPVGLDLISEVLHDSTIEEVNIVTLNHDTLVEQLLAREGIQFVDGFGEQDGDVRWYDDALYEKDVRVRLIKLHGSIDWYTFLRHGRLWPAILRRNISAEAMDSTGKLLTSTSRVPDFLCGGNKDAWYQHGMFADIHYRFHQLLRRCNRIVMSGFGWGDIGITNQIDRWFDQRPDNRLLLLHESPEEVVVSRSKILAMSYDGLTRRRQLVHVPQWLSILPCGKSRQTYGPDPAR